MGLAPDLLPLGLCFDPTELQDLLPGIINQLGMF
jgi:hypothetical protein